VIKLLRGIGMWVQGFEQRLFDWWFGVDTAGISRLHYAELPPEVGKSGYRYEPTPRRTFHRMLRSVCIDYSRFTFVDVGCGKGAVVLYASEVPFKRIIGIEVSPRLHQLAEKNIRGYPRSRIRCRDVSVVCGDGATFSFPNDPLVVYLFNPFNESTLSRLFVNIHRSLVQNPRRIVVVSRNPDCALQLAGEPSLIKEKEKASVFSGSSCS